MKIKIIDLLNMISKGEEVPRKFTYNGYLWEYDIKNKMWFYYFGEGKNHRFDKLFYLNMCLNDEVEIIEEEKKIEKIIISMDDTSMPYVTNNKYQKLSYSNVDLLFASKINELIDVIKDMRDKE